MQFPGSEKPPVGIVYDSDLGETIDTALALALIYGFDGKNEARMIAANVTKPCLKAAEFADAVGRFYNARTLPVGMEVSGGSKAETPMLKAPLARMNEEGKPAYANGIKSVNDTAISAAMLRNALTSQYDQNAVVILAGRATSLLQMLTLPGCKDLVAQKVRYLCVAYSEHTDVPAYKELMAVWPTLVITSGPEPGTGAPFPGESIGKDFAWSKAHPIVDAYTAYKPMPYDAPAHALAAALYAVRPQEGYFQVTPADGKRKQLVFDPAQRERIQKTYVEIASAKPVPRRMFGKPVQEQKKPEEKKPDEKKPEG